MVFYKSINIRCWEDCLIKLSKNRILGCILISKSIKINKSRILGFIFLMKINKNRIYWGPGVPWVGPWGPLGLWDPWALGALGLWGPLGPWGQGP